MTEPLGLALQRMREAQGLTIEELAEKSGVAASTIGKQSEARARHARIPSQGLGSRWASRSRRYGVYKEGGSRSG